MRADRETKLVAIIRVPPGGEVANNRLLSHGETVSKQRLFVGCVTRGKDDVQLRLAGSRAGLKVTLIVAGP